MSKEDDPSAVSPNVASEMARLNKKCADLQKLVYVNYFFCFALAGCVAFVMLRLGNAFQLQSEQAVIIEKILVAIKKIREAL